MPSVYQDDNFAGRVAYAADCISRQRCIGSRSFDTCFEMNDGDAVVTALVRRAQKNPKLAAALPLALNVESITARAATHAAVQTREFPKLAAKLRKEAGERHDRWMAELEAKQTAKA
jgi:hypothetical protein